MSAMNVVVKDSVQEAVDAFAEMQDRLHPRAIWHMVSVDLGTDVMDLGVNAYVTVDRLPSEVNSSKSADTLLRKWLTDRPMTVRELYCQFSQSRSANMIHSTANQVADVTEEWYRRYSRWFHNVLPAGQRNARLRDQGRT